MKQIKIVLFLFWALSLSNCKNMEEEKYEWLATVSAPQEYPVEVYSGAVIANDFSYGFDSIWGTNNPGWGISTRTMSVSTKEMEIPHTLEFTWLSLVEKKFYTGKWALDKEKIAQLFKQGFINDWNGEKGTYNEFKIGLAPKGRVVLWINGIGYQKEVGVFQAHDTIITKQKAYENAQYMLEDDYADERLKSDFLIKPDARERIAKYGYPALHIYDVYREKYHWKLALDLPEGYKADGRMYLLFCNGEQDDFKNDYTEKPIPFYISFSIINNEGKKYGVEITFTKDKNYSVTHISKGKLGLPADFDLNEINKIVHEKLNNKENMDFIITVVPQKEEVSICLKQKEKIFLLNETNKDIWLSE